MFTEFNPIVALWLLPVTLNIVLPLTMLLIYCVAKAGRALFALCGQTPDTLTTVAHQPAPSTHQESDAGLVCQY